MKTLILFIILIHLLVNSGCSNSNEPVLAGTLKGIVKDNQGNFISDAKIFIIYDWERITGLLPKEKNSNPLKPTSVILYSFTGVAFESGVKLSWITLSETDNLGFKIQMKTESVEWQTIGFIAGKGTTNDTSYYSFKHLHLKIGETNYYRLKIIDLEGLFEYSNEVEFILSPPYSLLNQNYPNPFDQSTTVGFVLRNPSVVTMDVCHFRNNSVIYTILDKYQLNAGNYEVLIFNIPSNGYKLTLKIEEADTTYKFEKDIFMSYSKFDSSIINSNPNAISQNGSFEIKYEDIPLGKEYVATGIMGPEQIGAIKIRNKINLVVYKTGYKIVQKDVNVKIGGDNITVVLEKE